jgi:spore coat polysaccharide biosynthesis protein SpsF
MKRTVLIGIQARSDSSRLPNKVHLRIGNRSILQVVIDSCEQTIKYMRHEADRLNAQVIIALLTSKSDPVVDIYRNQLAIIEGDHDDVLSRYVTAAEQFNADYIVRVTADCLWIPSHLIVKHIKSALIKQKDYTTNIHFRTFKEGYDCEVLSRRLLTWVDENATSKHDREHVTTIIAKEKFFPFKDVDGKKNICHILSEVNESDQKTSIDTREDYDKAVALYTQFKDLREQAKRNGIIIL